MAHPERIDLRKELKGLYSAKTVPIVVDVPAMNFLMIDGKGDPNTSPSYAAAIQALYAVAYTLKFTLKRGPRAVDFAVMPLEGLWWSGDMADFIGGNKARWQWTAMLMQPQVVTRTDVEAAIAAVRKKRPEIDLKALRFESFHEGKCGQLLHVGPYAAEGPNIERLHAFIAAQGGTLGGKHHEIYLSDPRRSKPEALKTIIRQPFT